MKTNNFKSFTKVSTFLLGLSILAAGCKKDEETKMAEDNINYNMVSLSSGQEVPANNSSASGTLSGKYDKNSNTFTYTINYSGVTPTAMHFHTGAIGTAGDVAAEVAGPYSSGMNRTLKLTDAQEADLLAGKWYLNVHSAAVPAGEIRGQIVMDHMVVLSNIALNGRQESPRNGSSATGEFNGWYDKTTKKITYTMKVNGVTPAAMHIHKGAMGENGEVVTEVNNNGGTTSALSAAQEADLLAGNLYINVHSAAFAGGEIRGQIVTEEKVVFSNAITGNNEVPASGSSASGTFYGVYNKSNKMLAYTIAYSGTTPTAMHLHKGAAGENGGVELEVAGPYSSGMKGSLTLNSVQEKDLLEGNLYLNVHSQAYPGGEIRAQLVK